MIDAYFIIIRQMDALVFVGLILLGRIIVRKNLCCTTEIKLTNCIDIALSQMLLVLLLLWILSN